MSAMDEIHNTLPLVPFSVRDRLLSGNTPHV